MSRWAQTAEIESPRDLRGDLEVDDTYQGEQISGLKAGATIAQWQPVYLDADSEWQLADASEAAMVPSRGLAVGNYSDGIYAVVLVRGTVRNNAYNFTPGLPLYLSETVGTITQTPPATTGSFVQQIGFAISADIIFVDFNSTFVELV